MLHIQFSQYYNKYLIERGSWSWLEDLLESTFPGLPKKLLWGRGRPQVSGMYEGWGQPGFLQDVTDQMAQDCPPFAHSHSPDLHPWPHQTNPHLAAEKERVLTLQLCRIRRTTMRIVKWTYCIPEGLPGREEGSLTAPLSAENGSTPEEAINIPKFNFILLF